jgi:hypothetical protein
MLGRVRLLAVAVIALQGGACATVIEGSTQVVSVSAVEMDGGAEIGGAECALSSPAIGTQKVLTPGSIKLDKSRHAIAVSCTKDGYEPGTGSITSHFAAATAGNILIGGLIGVGIDAASGAANKYDEKVTVTMAKKSEPPPAGRSAARRSPAPPPAKAVPASAQPAAPVEPPAKPPKCRDVGGYEAYKAKTGLVCEL